MIQHVLLFRFRPDAAPEAREHVLFELRSYPSLFPAMRDFVLGSNTSARDDRFSYAMTVRFANREELDAYLKSAIHESFVKETFRPVIEERAIASVEVEDC